MKRDRPHIPVGTRRNKDQPLYQEHKPWPSVPPSLEPTDQHLKDENVRGQQPLGTGHSSINLSLVCRTVLNWVEERIVVADGMERFVSGL